MLYLRSLQDLVPSVRVIVYACYCNGSMAITYLILNGNDQKLLCRYENGNCNIYDAHLIPKRTGGALALIAARGGGAAFWTTYATT